MVAGCCYGTLCIVLCYALVICCYGMLTVKRLAEDIARYIIHVLRPLTLAHIPLWPMTRLYTRLDLSIHTYYGTYYALCIMHTLIHTSYIHTAHIHTLLHHVYAWVDTYIMWSIVHYALILKYYVCHIPEHILCTLSYYYRVTTLVLV